MKKTLNAAALAAVIRRMLEDPAFAANDHFVAGLCTLVDAFAPARYLFTDRNPDGSPALGFDLEDSAAAARLFATGDVSAGAAVDEILNRLDNGDGADLIDKDCLVHGHSPHLAVFNQGGHDSTHACVPCVVELNAALADDSRGRRDPRAEEAQAYAGDYHVTATFLLAPTEDDEAVRAALDAQLERAYSARTLGGAHELLEVRRGADRIEVDAQFDRSMADHLDAALEAHPDVELEEALKLFLGDELRRSSEAGHVRTPFELKSVELIPLQP